MKKDKRVIIFFAVMLSFISLIISFVYTIISEEEPSSTPGPVPKSTKIPINNIGPSNGPSPINTTNTEFGLISPNTAHNWHPSGLTPEQCRAAAEAYGDNAYGMTTEYHPDVVAGGKVSCWSRKIPGDGTDTFTGLVPTGKGGSVDHHIAGCTTTGKKVSENCGELTHITEDGLIAPNTAHNWHAEGLTPQQCRAAAEANGDNAYGMSTQYHPDVLAGGKVSCWSRKIPGVGSDTFTGLVPHLDASGRSLSIAGCTTVGKKVSENCGEDTTYKTEDGLIAPNTAHNWHAEGLTPQQCRAAAEANGDNAYGMSTQYHPDVLSGKTKVTCWSRKIPGVGSDTFTGLTPHLDASGRSLTIAGCTLPDRKVSDNCSLPEYIREYGLISPNTVHNWHASGLTPEQCRAKAVANGDNVYGMSTPYHPDVIAGGQVSCWSRKIPGSGTDLFTGLVSTGEGGLGDQHIAGCTTIGKKVSNNCV